MDGNAPNKFKVRIIDNAHGGTMDQLSNMIAEILKEEDNKGYRHTSSCGYSCGTVCRYVMTFELRE